MTPEERAHKIVNATVGGTDDASMAKSLEVLIVAAIREAEEEARRGAVRAQRAAESSLQALREEVRGLAARLDSDADDWERLHIEAMDGAAGAASTADDRGVRMQECRAHATDLRSLLPSPDAAPEPEVA